MYPSVVKRDPHLRLTFIKRATLGTSRRHRLHFRPSMVRFCLSHIVPTRQDNRWFSWINILHQFCLHECTKWPFTCSNNPAIVFLSCLYKVESIFSCLAGCVFLPLHLIFMVTCSTVYGERPHFHTRSYSYGRYETIREHQGPHCISKYRHWRQH